jgi:hypothetical protein
MGSTHPRSAQSVQVNGQSFTIPNVDIGVIAQIFGYNDGTFGQQYHDARDPTGALALINQIDNPNGSTPNQITGSFTYDVQSGDTTLGRVLLPGMGIVFASLDTLTYVDLSAAPARSLALGFSRTLRSELSGLDRWAGSGCGCAPSRELREIGAWA